jgi:RNA polymerase sigma-54 factor
MSNISQRMDLRQGQNLVMTPQLQQAIKLLQLNNVELQEFIETELAQNPLLEQGAPDESAAETEAPAPERDGMNDEFDQSWTGNEKEAMPQDFDPGSSMATVGAGGNRAFDTNEEGFESHISRAVTLREHLLGQLHMAFEDPRDQLVGALLIDLLDEAGYLRHGLDELQGRLGIAKERLERMLTSLKQFSPTGVFARDLQECLALQLDEQGLLDAPMKILLTHLDRLAAHDFKALASLCGANETYLRDMIAEIRALQPRPASDFEPLVVQTVVPDVLMKRLPNNLGGGWRVELNAETLPRVLVNQSYYTEVAKKTKERKDKDYLNQQLNSANWLVKALDQRAKTILKVASEIIERQEAFFLYGIEFLRPLTLKDIAEKIDMHESTVSRVTTNKFIGTPRGVFELKYFFSTALGEGDSAHSAESIKARIKTMIDAEKAEATLSDDTIAEILQKDGVDIARRTVAKYREMLRIPSSVQRRKIKKTRPA